VASHVLIELAGSAQAIISSFTAPADTARKNLRAHLPLSENAKRALGQASEESLALAHNFIGTEHILLGILAAVPPGRAATILSGLGISSAVVRRRILHKLGGFTKADQIR
jgi:ATP-dependent Clp protease ATP-binding subunit ClpA